MHAFITVVKRSDTLAPAISRLSTVTCLYMMGILYGHISKDRFAGDELVPNNFGRYVSRTACFAIISDGIYFVLFRAFFLDEREPTSDIKRRASFVCFSGCSFLYEDYWQGGTRKMYDINLPCKPDKQTWHYCEEQTASLSSCRIHARVRLSQPNT